MPDFTLEDAFGAGFPVAGVDEAGRGPWAGPVIAAAVVLDVDRMTEDLLTEIDDSKRLSAARRESLFAALDGCAAVGIGRAEVEEIDALNIREATLVAMRRAVLALPAPPGAVLVDGRDLPRLPCPGRAVVGGDRTSLSIAAASIAAKVTRDRIMADLDRAHPGYGWSRNKGYGTREHAAALARLGPSPVHRRSFRPVRLLLDPVLVSDGTKPTTY